VDFVDKNKVFYLGINHAEKIIEEIREMVLSDKQFAVLIPTGLIPEISRLENVNGISKYDDRLEKLIHSLSKIVLSQTNDTWLLKLRSVDKLMEVLLTESVGCDSDEITELMAENIETLILESEHLPDWVQHNEEVESYIETRNMRLKSSPAAGNASSMTTLPKLGVRKSSKKNVTSQSTQGPVVSMGNEQKGSKELKYNNIILAPITKWVGKQLLNQKIPKTIKSHIITSYEKYPDGLRAVPSHKEGRAPRIIVPADVQKDLVMQAHLDIHHQNHSKVYRLLSPLYYWPSMFKDVEDICKACNHCLSGTMRREKLQSLFDMNTPLSRAAPRQHYGIDFYGLMTGEILIMVDLFNREVTLQWLPSRNQENVARTILRRIIFERGVPISLRSDNAPELMKGIVKKICAYLNIQ
jgi:hypothetical protein